MHFCFYLFCIVSKLSNLLDFYIIVTTIKREDRNICQKVTKKLMFFVERRPSLLSSSSLSPDRSTSMNAVDSNTIIYHLIYYRVEVSNLIFHRSQISFLRHDCENERQSCVCSCTTLALLPSACQQDAGASYAKTIAIYIYISIIFITKSSGHISLCCASSDTASASLFCGAR